MLKKINLVFVLLGCIAITTTSLAQTKTNVNKATRAKTSKAQVRKIIFTKDNTTGVEYHFFKHDKKGKKPVIGDFANVKLVFKNDKDSEISNSATKGGDSLGTYKIPLTKYFTGCLEQGITLMAIGDSVEFKVSTDSVFNKFNRTPNAKMPSFLHAGTFLTFNVKLIKFQTEKENNDEREQLKAKYTAQMLVRKAQEPSAIAKYLADNKITAKPTEDSLFFIMRKDTGGKAIKEGDSVFVKYTLYLLDNTILET
jgi:hypothetical protein